VFLVAAWHGDGRPTLDATGTPTFHERTQVTLSADTRFVLTSRESVRIDGVLDGVQHDDTVLVLAAGPHVARTSTQLTFPADALVPHARKLEPSSGHDWARPLSGSGGREHPLYSTYSLILALFFGTMGLPHVLVRFYTNPDGRAARRTTLFVLALLGAFYLFPTVYGALARLYTPDLLLTGRTDAAVLLLPDRMVGGLLGDLLGALVTAGAFAAFLSTSSGLTVSVAGVLSQDVLRGTVRDFRVAAALAVTVPFGISLAASSLAVADVVGLAFAVAASSFCPLLLLGIWWRGLTPVGATAGLLVGGGLAIAAVSATIAGASRDGWLGALLAQPAAWTVPIAFLVMITVSLRTRHQVPAHVARTMVRLHTPEALHLRRDTPRHRRPV
jgi:Na+(H+)/acetate symporter ActP